MRHAALISAAVLLPLVAQAGYRASSFKKDNRMGDNYWNARAALDGDVKSCWMVDPEHENKGEWLEIDIPKSTVDKLSVVIGWADSEETFQDYSRLKSVRLEVTDEATGNVALEKTVQFEDRIGAQEIELDNTAVGGEFSGGKVKLTVLEVYEGQDFPSLAVSEVLVKLVPEEVYTALIAEPAAEAGHPASNLVDQDARTFWVGEGADIAFTVEASGFGVSGLSFTSGPNGYTRPKTLEITANDRPYRMVLENKAGAQTLSLPTLQGFTGSMWGQIGVKVIDTWEGGNGKIALSEVRLQATSFDGI
ncbi:MAG: hypothetical protein JXX28_10135 [Deltaproteobacteria bacterium]|nr:hypothetical protein [Deltaproteobacteria bacterium]